MSNLVRMTTTNTLFTEGEILYLPNASYLCYCVFNLREMSVLIEICIASSSIFSLGVSVGA